MKSFATILALAVVAVNAASKSGDARANAEGNAWGPGGNPEKGGNGGDNNGNAWGPGGNPEKGGNGGDNNGNAYGPDGKRVLEGKAYAYGREKENNGNRWGPGGNPEKGGNGGDNNGNAYGPDGKVEGVQSGLGGISLVNGTALVDAKIAGPKGRSGAMMVRADCKDMSDDGMMKVFARAHSWEADGSGDEIRSKRTQAKVDAMEVMIRGYAKGPADSTCYAFIESDCTATAPAAYDTAEADFDVDTNMGGIGRFRFKTDEYVASDLIDGAMTLNLRDADGASMLCCVFEELEF